MSTRYPPKDEKDRSELVEHMEASEWMIEQLSYNPDYLNWGPYEDYMYREDKGWESRIILDGWLKFKEGWTLDDYNEIVNFYFEIDREAKDCEICCGQGTHPDAQWISESFYKHSSPFVDSTILHSQSRAVLDSFLLPKDRKTKHSVVESQFATYPNEELLGKYNEEFRVFCKEMRIHGCWHDRITQAEVGALLQKDRLHYHFQGRQDLTAEEVNKWAGHDAINRWILIEERLKQFGIPQYCENCDGQGAHFIAPARLDLILWVIHPRKGCSRGIEIKDIQQEQLSECYAFLREAASRNTQRFERIPNGNNHE